VNKLQADLSNPSSHRKTKNITPAPSPLLRFIGDTNTQQAQTFAHKRETHDTVTKDRCKWGIGAWRSEKPAIDLGSTSQARSMWNQ
jgi:hypothetical protein